MGSHKKCDACEHYLLFCRTHNVVWCSKCEKEWHEHVPCEAYDTDPQHDWLTWGGPEMPKDQGNEVFIPRLERMAEEAS